MKKGGSFEPPFLLFSSLRARVEGLDYRGLVRSEIDSIPGKAPRRGVGRAGARQPAGNFLLPDAYCPKIT